MKITGRLKIGGLQKTTLIDYPGKVACTVFLIGCNFRCPFCYSSELVLPEKIKLQPLVAEKDFFNFLAERKGLLDGVVICGGEPTILAELPAFIKRIKKLGYLVKLDTNGSNPQILKKLIKDGLLDYVAMDVKSVPEKYSEITQSQIKISQIQASIDLLKEGLIDYEFRSTIVPGFHLKADIIKLAHWLQGAKKYYLQNFRPEKTINPSLEKVEPYTEEFLLEIKKEISPLFNDCQVRG